MGDQLTPGSGPGLGSGPGPAGLIGRTVVSVGVDLVDIDRIRRVIERQPRFVERVYTAGEQAYCRKRRDPAERFAARFAAKEAVLKAIGTGLGGADFTDIEVVRRPSGQPELVVRGRAEAKATELGIGAWLLTITHSANLAQAFVVGLAEPSERSG